MKTETRIIAEKIQKLKGKSLIWINFHACQYVAMGLCADRKEALEYMLSVSK